MLPGDDKYERPIGVLFDVGKERTVAGQLTLRRGDLLDSNVVHIFDRKFFSVPDHGSLCGVSEAGKVSLLDCVSGRVLGGTNWRDFAIHHGNIAFRYALFGSRHIAADEPCVRGIRFVLEGVESSVFMQSKFDSYGFIGEPDQEIIDAINRKKPDYLKGDLAKDRAIVSYFTGDYGLLPRTPTVLGTIHASRDLTIRLPEGNISETSYIAIEFDDHPTTVTLAWEKMREVRQFFTWVMGYVPAWRSVGVSTSKLDRDGHRRDPIGEFEVFGPKEWKGVPESASQYGTLIDASKNPEHFMEVMRTWLERNANRRRKSANTRFFGSFQGTNAQVIEDGIVSAGNMFDLLPSEDKPPHATPLPEDALDILKDATNKIKLALGKHPEKKNVLNALGRIRANKHLSEVVDHRAKVVLDHYREYKLRNLRDDLRLAVQCRNYYTHGPSNAKAYALVLSNYDVVHFLTETLAFIYGTSELLLCGWDGDTSVADAWHPLGGYIKRYESHRAVLLRAVSTEISANDESEFD